MLQGHGNDIHAFKNQIVADFSSNIWHAKPKEGLLNEITKSLSHLHNYPEPDAASLNAHIAKLHQIPQENILATNGASEAFYLIAQLFSGAGSTIFYPAFAEYEDACATHKHKISHQSISSFNEKTNFNNQITCWIGNPNNPNGNVLPLELLLKIIETHPNTTFIVDEAYGELCHNFESLIPYCENFQNLIIVKSLTKAFSIAGLRLGYLIASKTNILQIKAIKTPWSVNNIAIAAGKYITKNYKRLLPDKLLLSFEIIEMQKEMANIPQIKITPSQCNFFLAQLQCKTPVSKLKSDLIENYGFLIRDASNFRGLNSSFFRVATQGQNHNKALIKAIKKCTSAYE